MESGSWFLFGHALTVVNQQMADLSLSLSLCHSTFQIYIFEIYLNIKFNIYI